MEQKVTMKLFRKYHYGEYLKSFTPTSTQITLANSIYKKIIKLKPTEKVKFNSKKYKDIEKAMSVLNVKYFPYFELEAEQEDDGESVTYIIKGKRVQNAIFQNKKIKDIVAKTIRDIGITTKHTQKEAVIMINDYFNKHYKYLDYGYFDNSSYNKLLFTKKSGVCQDYAYAFYLLASYCGITVAQCYSHEDMDHAFNCVKINGKVTYLDTCWNPYCDNKYLFMDKKDFETEKYHRIDSVIWG